MYRTLIYENLEDFRPTSATTEDEYKICIQKPDVHFSHREQCPVQTAHVLTHDNSMGRNCGQVYGAFT